MLKSFRNASNSIVIKILFGAIIFSFCLWGVGDIVRNYSSSKTVLTVEKATVSYERFRTEYNQEKQKIRNSGTKALSDVEIKKIDIKGTVITRLMQNAVLEQMFAKLNIVVPKKTIMNIVNSLPEFQSNGVFDSNIYANVLRKSGMSDSGFLHQLSENVARNQLLHPIIAGYNIPDIIKDNIAKEFEVKKTILISTIHLSDMKVDKEPTTDDLKQYFNANSDKYKKPETRDAAILVINYKNLSADIKISKEEIDEYYESNKEAFSQDEHRDFERFIFESKEDADKAWNMINKGVKTSEIAKKLLPTVEALKAKESADFPDKIAKVLFGLKLNKVSQVFEIDDKYYIYKVTKIDSPKHKSESEIRKEIEAILQNDKRNSPEFYNKIKEMKNKIDDGFGSGKDIDTVAKETGMKLVEFKTVHKVGDNKELKALIPTKEMQDDIEKAIFETDESQASPTIDSKEDETLSYVVYTRKIAKESIPAFETISSKVKEDFLLEKKDKKAIEQIESIFKEGKDGAKKVAKLPGVHSFNLSKKDLILHQKSPTKEVDRILSEIPNANAVFELLSTLKNGEGEHVKLPNGDYLLIFLLKRGEIDAPTPGFRDIISQDIDSKTSNDASALAMSAFKSQLNIKTDNKLIDDITTSTDEDEDK